MTEKDRSYKRSIHDYRAKRVLHRTRCVKKEPTEEERERAGMRGKEGASRKGDGNRCDELCMPGIEAWLYMQH